MFLTENSVIILKSKRDSFVDQDLFNEAATSLAEHGCLVISYDDEKTWAVIKDVTSNNPRPCLIVNDCSSFMYIDLSMKFLLIIDMTLQHDFDNSLELRWLEHLDMIKAHVEEGNLQVILKCPQSQLDEFLLMTGEHPLLKHRIPSRERCSKRNRTGELTGSS